MCLVQVNEIRKSSLARIICDNTDDIGQLQPLVMMLSNKYENCPVNCNNSVIDTLDISQWMDNEPKFTLPVSKETLKKAARLSQQRVLNENQAIALRKLYIHKHKGSQHNFVTVDPASSFSNDDSSPISVHANILNAKQESLDISKKSRILLEMTKVLLSGYITTKNKYVYIYIYLSI
jgi:hypothetical protein